MRPDAVRGSQRYLTKNVGLLRLTYQIRLLAYAAAEDQGQLILVLPEASRLSNDLRQFIRSQRQVKVQRT
jgi:hypothetical protein